MIEVTRDEFYKALYADKRDIMPSLANSARWTEGIGYTAEWRDKSGRLFGKSDDNHYWLVADGSNQQTPQPAGAL